MASYFKELLETFDLIAINPPILEPTLSNGKSGKYCIHKRLDIFIAKTTLVQSFYRYRTWVGSKKFSDHYPFFLQVEGISTYQNYPFKFNNYWLDNEYFYNFITDFWLSYKITEFTNPMYHSVYKLRQLKNAVTGWIKYKKAKDREDYSLLENQVRLIHQKNPDYTISEAELFLIKDLENKKKS